jgi:hypothetical protein
MKDLRLMIEALTVEENTEQAAVHFHNAVRKMMIEMAGIDPDNMEADNKEECDCDDCDCDDCKKDDDNDDVEKETVAVE